MPTTPISQAALQHAFDTLSQCDRGQQVAALLAPVLHKAVYLDNHYRVALCVVFQALQENALNGSLVDLSRMASDLLNEDYGATSAQLRTVYRMETGKDRI